jgi:hypothetical protein
LTKYYDCIPISKTIIIFLSEKLCKACKQGSARGGCRGVAPPGKIFRKKFQSGDQGKNYLPLNKMKAKNLIGGPR